MPEHISNIIITFLLIGIGALALIGIIIKIIKNKCAPTKTVEAIVIDKQKVEAFSKYSGSGKQERFVVVFSAEGKKLSFYVSQFSYNGYKVNEKGTLKYKGNRIIEFN